MTKPAYVLLEGKENVRTPSLRDTMFDLLALAIIHLLSPRLTPVTID